MRTRAFLPRPEYPRPDRQRAFVHGVDWVNLNGPWELRFDGDKVGVEQEWFHPNPERWNEQIIVPFCWESLAAWGEADAAGNDHYYSNRVFRNPLDVTPDNHRSSPRYEVAWYRRWVEIPANEHWEGKRVILTIGAADFFTDGWCNGVALGHNEGGYNSFEFDLTDALQRAPDGRLCGWIVLRVEDPMDNHEQPVGKQWGWYSSASGIWQTVFLEPRAAESITHFRIVTDITRKEVAMQVWATGKAKSISLEVTAPDGAASKQAIPWDDEAACFKAAFLVDPMFLWDPNDPQLYKIKLTFEGKSGADVVYSYFGMRSLSAEPVEEAQAPAALCLNGKPIYIRGALYQSYFPEGIYTAGDIQTLRDDIIYAKRVGFDLLRVHIKIDDPLLLYCADTQGILLMADFPNFGEGGDTPLGRRRFEEMMRNAIERDFNHPSIVAWCLFNETWGFGGQKEFVNLINPGFGKPAEVRAPGTKYENLSAYEWVQAMWNLAKRLDPYRLVEDMSVVAWDHLQYYGHGDTDVNSWHFYTDNYDRAREHIEEVVEKTYAGSDFNYVPGYIQGSQPLINSEYGGVGALDGDRDVSWSFKFLTNELRRHGKLSAYIYTELHDVEWERNGFLNYDRTPKEFGYDPVIVNNGDVLPMDAPPIARYEPGQEVVINVCSSHFSRRMYENVTLFWRLSSVDSMGWIDHDYLEDSKPIPFPHHAVALAENVRLTLPNKTALCTLWVRATTPSGVIIAANYIQLYVDGGYPVSEEKEKQWILRLPVDQWSKAEWNHTPLESGLSPVKGMCQGNHHGFFEWQIEPPLERSGIRSIRILCEASSNRGDMAQTDQFSVPTTLHIRLNGILVHQVTLPNHPYDARGAMSYLSGGKGEYGYLIHSTLEGPLLQAALDSADKQWTLRFEVPENAEHVGGLTIYGGPTGRYPVPPTLILEKQPKSDM